MDSGSVTYAHNGQGQRVLKDDGSETLFAYDEAGQLVGEYDEYGAAIQETVWFNGMPVAVLVGSNKYYVHTDHLGTPRAITSGNTVIWRWESDPFGSTAAQEDPDGNMTNFTYNLRFPGQYYDSETGLHYNYFRTYDPSTGRYLESDPIGLVGGPNTYGYVRGSPLTYADPFGLETKSVGQWPDFLNSIDVASASTLDRDQLPARSRELRNRNRAMTAQLAIAAARQAAHDGSALACDVISYEAVSLAGGFLIGSGLYVAAIPARAALATASRLELTNSAASLVSAANIFAGTANTSEVIATIGVLQAERQVLIMELAKLTATTTITIEIVSD